MQCFILRSYFLILKVRRIILFRLKLSMLRPFWKNAYLYSFQWLAELTYFKYIFLTSFIHLTHDFILNANYFLKENFKLFSQKNFRQKLNLNFLQNLRIMDCMQVVYFLSCKNCLPFSDRTKNQYSLEPG